MAAMTITTNNNNNNSSQLEQAARSMPGGVLSQHPNSLMGKVCYYHPHPSAEEGGTRGDQGTRPGVSGRAARVPFFAQHLVPPVSQILSAVTLRLTVGFSLVFP